MSQCGASLFRGDSGGYVALLASSQLTFEEAAFLREDCGAAALVLGAGFEQEPHEARDSGCCAAPILTDCWSVSLSRTTRIRARTTRLSRLHIRNDQPPQGRLARPSRGMGAPNYVSTLARDWPDDVMLHAGL